MYTRILYPTDGSQGATAALAHCRTLAKTYDAAVHVLYVAEQLGPFGLESDVEVEAARGSVADPHGAGAGMVASRTKRDEIRAHLEEQGATLVAEVAGQFDAVETHTAVQTGRPHQAILDYAANHAIDLIVMGTHGRTGLDRYLIGSVAEKVVRMSEVPVLTVHQADD